MPNSKAKPEDSFPRRILHSALLAIPGTLFVGFITFICFNLHLNVLTVSFCYLVAVVLQSLFGNFPSSAIVSFISFLFLNYFFVPPLFSLRVSDASDTVALTIFLLASLVITRLTSQAHLAATSEEQQRRRMTHLYQLARLLLEVRPSPVVSADLLEPFRTEFALRAVCLFEPETGTTHINGVPESHLAETTRASYLSRTNFNDASQEIAVRVLSAGGRMIGAVGFEGLHDLEVTADPLAALAGIVVERCYTFDQTSRATVAAETELLRGAVLDALAHEFKTPLATILTAASALRSLARLQPGEVELAKAVESEASQLSTLTSRLLRLARLEREDVKPQMDVVSIRDLLSALVQQYCQRWPDRTFVLVNNSAMEATADRELLWLGIGQLIDNACKYSTPGSEVTIVTEITEQEIAIYVRNSGSSIPEKERSRVFERFYRGQSTKAATQGSGLGLYVARKDCGRARRRPSVGGHWRTLHIVPFLDFFCRGDNTLMTPRFDVLIVDDEAQLRKVLQTTLAARGFSVDEASSGERAIEIMQQQPFHLVLLDVNMPGMGGIEACRRIRSMFPQSAIVMVTVRDAEADIVQALEAGADDYITKPFRYGELVARVKAVLRRTVGESGGVSVLQAGDIEIDLEKRLVRRSGEVVHLTPTEFDLLAMLMKNEGTLLTHKRLLQAIWGPEYGQELEYLRSYVRTLRKKLEDDPALPKYILTEPWVGYRFQNPTEIDLVSENRTQHVESERA